MRTILVPWEYRRVPEGTPAWTGQGARTWNVKVLVALL